MERQQQVGAEGGAAGAFGRQAECPAIDWYPDRSLLWGAGQVTRRWDTSSGGGVWGTVPWRCWAELGWRGRFGGTESERNPSSAGSHRAAIERSATKHRLLSSRWGQHLLAQEHAAAQPTHGAPGSSMPSRHTCSAACIRRAACSACARPRHHSAPGYRSPVACEADEAEAAA